MKLAHSVRASVFSHENESSSEIVKGLAAIFPFDLEKNKLKVQNTMAEGALHNKIGIHEIFVEKESLVNSFIENLLEKLGKSQVEALKEQKESRLDAESNFFIRIEKDYWILQNKMALTDSGNCYRIKISIAAFPKKRENAMKIVDKILDKL
jgi:RNA binding exosome subunit